MKKSKIAGLLLMGIIVSVLFTTCSLFGDMEDIRKEALEKEQSTKTVLVIVSAQNGTLPAEKSTTITFPVTTVNIADGEYPATVSNLPKGMTVDGPVTIAGDIGLLTLAADNTTVANSYGNLRLTINGITSPAFTLVISTANTKSVLVGAQTSTMIERTGGTSVNFPVGTANIENGETGTIEWYTDLSGTEAIGTPTGITASVTTVTNSTATVTINGSLTALTGLYFFTVTIDNTESGVATFTILPRREVKVGTQQNTLVEKIAGATTTFPVTTENVEDHSYSVTVANLPAGVTVSGQVVISGNSGILTLAGSVNALAGITSNLTLTIDGLTSATFTLEILSQSVNVGAQSAQIRAGIGGSANFNVTTANIASGQACTVTWYSDSSGNTSTTAATGISSSTTSISGNSASVTITATTAAAAATRYFRVTVAGIQSNVATLTILPAKTVSVGTQVGTLIEKTAGTVTFPVTTTNIDNASYTVTVQNRPLGVDVQGQVQISSGSGTLTLAGNTSTLTGTTSTLTLTIDGVTSAPFTLFIDSKTVSAVYQSGALSVGNSGSMSFTVSTKNISGTYAATVAGLPGGLSVFGGQVTISGTSGTLTITGTPTNAGTFPVTLTIDNTTSPLFNIVIKSVSVGAQGGALIAGTVGTVTFPVTTVNIANGTYPATLDGFPGGISILGAQVVINNNGGTLTLSGTTETAAGTTTSLSLTIDSVASAQFPLTISGAKTVSVAAQNTVPAEKFTTSVTFPVKTTSITTGSYSATVTGLPTGVSYSSPIAINSSGDGTLTLTGTGSALSGTYSLTLTIDVVTSPAFDLKIKGASVGTQAGTINAGTAGTVTFPVTTVNIDNGSYSVTVANLPAGVTVSGNVTINNNSGTLTLSASTSAVAATTGTLTLSINNVTTAAFTLTIKRVTVGAQSGGLNTGVGGSVTFPVTTGNINAGLTGTITWYTTLEGITETAAANGVTSSVGTVTSNAVTVTVTTTSATTAATRYFKVTVDGIQSSIVQFVVSPAAAITIGAQSGSMAEKISGTVTYPVTMTNTPAGTYTATVANLPTGVTVSGSVTISGSGTGTLTLAGGTTTERGTYNNLTLEIRSVKTTAFTLNIKGVVVGSQTGSINSGTAGPVTFSVTTTNIANGQGSTITWYTTSAGTTTTTAPTGISTSIPTVSNNATTLTMTATIAAEQGAKYFTVTTDGAKSTVQTLTILAPKTVSVGSQTGRLVAGISGSVTYTISTDYIPLGTYTVTVANRPTGITVSGTVTIYGVIGDSGNLGRGTLTLAGSTATVSGTTSTLTLTINGVTSGNFSVRVLSHIASSYSATISGSNWVKGTLNGSLSPTPNQISLIALNPSYEWKRGSMTGTVVSSSTSYTLTSADYGQYIYLTITANGTGSGGSVSTSIYCSRIGIYDLTDLKNIWDGTLSSSNYGLNRNFILVNDITISGTWSEIGNPSQGEFNGLFDGNGKTIHYNWPTPGYGSYHMSDGYRYGLFGKIGSSGEVRDLKLTGTIFITGGTFTNTYHRVGAVAGMNSGLIRNVNSNVFMEVNIQAGSNLGGIAGNNVGGTIRNCSYTAGGLAVLSADGSVYVGSIAGITSGTIQYCYSTYSAINVAKAGTTVRSASAGGIVGYSESGGWVSNCVALNYRLYSTYQNRTMVGRIAGALIANWSSGAINYGSTDMGLYYNGPNGGSSFNSNTLGSSLSNGQDGTSVARATTETQSWWTSYPVWTFPSTPSTTNPWKWSSYYYRPILWFE